MKERRSEGRTAAHFNLTALRDNYQKKKKRRISSGRKVLVKMPRVVPDQRSKFENEEFFRKLSRECEVSLRRSAEIQRERRLVRGEKRAVTNFTLLGKTNKDWRTEAFL